MGPFSLKVDCSFPFDLQEIPQEGAGMYTRVVLGAWCVGFKLGPFAFFETLFREEHTAAGGPSFDRYSNNPIFELEVPSLAQVKYVVANSYYYYLIEQHRQF
jgi:calpain-7